MMFKKLSTIFLAVSALCSCAQRPGDSLPTIKYVRQIVAEKNSAEYFIAAGYDNRNRDADIYILGEPERVNSMRDLFLRSDSRDNIDGSSSMDDLPDFAGETFACIPDSANAPYSAMLGKGKGKEDAFCEFTVRECLAAIDTVCSMSEFDTGRLGRKRTSKMIVLTSPESAAYGEHDIDTLGILMGKNFNVVSCLGTATERAFRTCRGPLRIGYITRPENNASEACKDVFLRFVYKFGRKNADCFVFAPDSTGGDVFRNFMDSYIRASKSAPLSVIIVDDPDLDVNAMHSSYDYLTSIMNSESLTYSKYISESFDIIDAEEITVSTCYDILRKQNLFTHNITMPKAINYLTSKEAGKLIMDRKYVQE